MVDKRIKKKRLFSDFRIIYPEFQGPLLFINGFVIFMTMFVVCLQSWMTMGVLKDMGDAFGPEVGEKYFLYLEQQSNYLFFYLAGVGVMGFVVSSLGLLFLSNRLAGPLYRMKLHFENMIVMKEYRPINFRKGDFLSDLAPIINKAMETLYFSRTEHKLKLVEENQQTEIEEQKDKRAA